MRCMKRVGILPAALLPDCLGMRFVETAIDDARIEFGFARAVFFVEMKRCGIVRQQKHKECWLP